ncbi:hypothetical protein T440DRAFT_497285 [Plenodomus tracheiphilus IPT5]|uniref:Uncharacterized protein n=1 Tax=Plenodomus tracheiphilus IPT5 TaxID=1408161 RepID=A0A6A7BBQ3_9PLEO|nr:hypothetical protein T440DRAFT_497285 [Plenodomus tracheiphilus IPT5]
MSYATEDEIDWSDGTLHTPAPAYHEPDTAYMYPSAAPVDDEKCQSATPADDEKYDSLFESDGAEQPSFVELARLHTGLPLELTASNENSQKSSTPYVFDAGDSPRTDRRIPSKRDYMEFALYQGNQKAYEATLLKQFIAHALHPDQINKCFDGKGDPRGKVDRYMALISRNVDKIANKMVWNAHHRVISMFADEGKESASFLHVHELTGGVFADFGPGSTSRPARKLSESWHRDFPEPVMLRLSTAEYPLGRHSHPLEDIDDLAKTLANYEASSEAVPVSCIVPAPPKKRKQTIANPTSPPRGISQVPEAPAPMPRTKTSSDDVEATYIAQLEQAGSSALAGNPTHPYDSHVAPTQLELLFERHGAGALAINQAESSTGCGNKSALINVTSWPAKLLTDHKRRLTERWGDLPQALETMFLGFEQVYAETIAKGYRPTAPDWRERAQKIALREKNTSIFNPVVPVSEDDSTSAGASSSARSKSPPRDVVPPCILATTIPTKPVERSKSSTRPIAKKRRIDAPVTTADATKSRTTQKTVTSRKSSKSGKTPDPPVGADDTSLPPHPSGSMTLEPDQILPPDAYFKATSPDEKPAWRCSIKHAMGHYYNAGDRKACRGCNTSLMDIPKVKQMDFYLPRRQFFHQPAAGMLWKPCKPSGKARKSDRPCHNSVAKDAFWAAVDGGASDNQARHFACNAVKEFLKPKPKPRKEPTPEPTPEPEPDLGPHPSGSDTMEHGQDLPECAYWKKEERHEDYAWRCDVSHALGRYYLAGDKKSCLGCGTNKGGLGRQTIMDFYLPPGTILRQEAPGLVKWKPRQYKARTTSISKNNKTKHTHNQICAEKYFQAKAEGYGDEQALNLAVERTDAWLDGKQDELTRKHEEQEDAEAASSVVKTATTSSASHSQKNSTHTTPANGLSLGSYRRNSRGGCTVSLVPAKRSSDELDDAVGAESDFGDDEGSAGYDMHGIPPYNEIFEISSAEEESSGSDCE